MNKIEIILTAVGAGACYREIRMSGREKGEVRKADIHGIEL
jgi:hypothetical protein